ncbi:MAG: aminotransferase class V-fold PLP-dependent enzyme [Candidatus Magasanikbacteria bacterium]|jgi:cysteine desulfurase / selenocysteine lyase|nr:aminotransferase class V-fold PLP-dependent enzyme [Candidatus Magasanikbacteria bacterium]
MNNFPANNAAQLYLDSASSALMCQEAIDAVHAYNTQYPVNVHRGMYKQAEQADEAFNAARKVVATYIGAHTDEIIFTSGTTQSLNMIAQMLAAAKPDMQVAITALEHHANMIPWQQHAARVAVIPVDMNTDVVIDELETIITQQTDVVAFTLMSNVTGTVTPYKQIIARAKEVGAIVVADGAQFIAHYKIDVQEFGIDVLAFSGHKVYGPTGIGALFISKELQQQLQPVVFGGDMVDSVTYERATWAEGSGKFEAGTPNISGAIGMAAALQMMTTQQVELDTVRAVYAEAIAKHASIIESAHHTDRGPIISFTMTDMHPHDIAQLLAVQNIAVRAGHHCAMPLMQYISKEGVVRVSLGMYSKAEDADTLGKALEKTVKINNQAKAAAVARTSGLDAHYRNIA